VAIEGVNAKDAHERTGLVRTFVENPKHLNIVALSCDRPERLQDGETNMWLKLADQVKAGEGNLLVLSFCIFFPSFLFLLFPPFSFLIFLYFDNAVLLLSLFLFIIFLYFHTHNLS
jgi:hypothetical protein